MHICQLPFVDDCRELGLDRTVSVVVPPGASPSSPFLVATLTVLPLFLPSTPPIDEQTTPTTTSPTNPQSTSRRRSSKAIRRSTIRTCSRTLVRLPSSLFLFFSLTSLPPFSALNYFYETLAAVALDEELPTPDDRTVPAYAVIDEVRLFPFFPSLSLVFSTEPTTAHPLQRSGKYISSLLPPDDIDASRLATSSKKRPVAKKDKPEVKPEDLEEFVELYREKGGKIKVDELKGGLRQMCVSLFPVFFSFLFFLAS
jgi:hypothetical protein